MKKLGGFIIVFLSAGVALAAAQAGQRIFTNPKPEAHLKRLFPRAAAFSPLQGNPLHYDVFAAALVEATADDEGQAHGEAVWIG